MNEGKTYISFLASRVPNNHCELCSYIIPPMSSVGRQEWMGFSASTTCSSCGRGATRLFVEEGKPGPERVPDDYVTTAHGDPKTLAKDEKLLHPTHPREGYDGPTFWAAMLQRDKDRFKEVLPSQQKLEERFPHLKAPNLETKTVKKAKNEEEPEFNVDAAKVVKRKLNFGN